MKSQNVLDALLQEFEGVVKSTNLLDELRTAEQNRVIFCEQMYPFLRDPTTIEQYMVSGEHARTFIGWLESQLGPLGGINLYSNKPIETLATSRENREKLRWLLHQAFERDVSAYQKADLPWGQIPYFGDEDSDRQIPKKIISTYYPLETLPIFKIADLEYFISDHVLGVRPARDSKAKTIFGMPYGDDLRVGQKWQVLCETLLDEKATHPLLRKKDNVYFMRCLYTTSPPPRQ